MERQDFEIRYQFNEVSPQQRGFQEINLGGNTSDAQSGA